MKTKGATHALDHFLHIVIGELARLKQLLAVLEQTFMLRLLPPLEANLSKRLVRSPKLYLRDSGLLHNLLGIETYDDLLAHPQAGESWEGFVIGQVVELPPRLASDPGPRRVEAAEALAEQPARGATSCRTGG